MADNVPITPGVGTNVATDDIGGVQYQRVKPQIGADGVAADVDNANPWPVAMGHRTTAALDSAQINASASGDNTLLAGTGGQTIRMFKGWLVAAAAVSIKFKDGASTDFHPAIALNAGASWFFDFDGEPWFVTSSGNGLVLNLSAAVQVSGRFHYKKS